MIIGISGYARSGKDTAAEKLIELGFKRVAFADKLREFALRLDPIVDVHRFADGMGWPTKRVTRFSDVVDDFGWDGYKASKFGPEMRRLLQVLGTECGRELISDTVWIDAALGNPCATVGDIVVTDVRFPNEADAIRARGGCVFRVVRPGVGPVNNHPSETALDDWDFDAVIDNDEGIGELHDCMAGLVAGLRVV